ncbi:hypothetical protein WK00_26695 [Burkholderia ubonensis]|nr:hypothetical protein WK00_26695 [Burkholderia ubonensis]
MTRRRRRPGPPEAPEAPDAPDAPDAPNSRMRGESGYHRRECMRSVTRPRHRSVMHASLAYRRS